MITHGMVIVPQILNSLQLQIKSMNWIETYLGVPIVLSMIGILLLIEGLVKSIADDIKSAIQRRKFNRQLKSKKYQRNTNEKAKK